MYNRFVIIRETITIMVTIIEVGIIEIIIKGIEGRIVKAEGEINKC